MSTWIDIIITGFMGFIGWYSEEALSAPDLLTFLAKQLTMYILLQAVLYVIPFLKKIVNLLCFPFRFLHVTLHISKGKEVARELEEKYEEEEELDPLLDRYTLRSSLTTGLDRDDENPVLLASANRINYAKKVGLAPSRVGLVMFAGYLVLAPIAWINDAFTSTGGALIHFYFFLGIFGTMMPSLNDWLYVIHTIILNLEIRPIYYYNSMLVHVVFTFDTFWRTHDSFIAIFTGTVWFLIYLGGLFGVALYAQRKRRQQSKIYIVPFKSPKEIKKTLNDVEFDYLEDYELDD